MSQDIESDSTVKALTRKIGDTIISWDAYSCQIVSSIPGGKMSMIGRASDYNHALQKFDELERILKE